MMKTTCACSRLTRVAFLFFCLLSTFVPALCSVASSSQANQASMSVAQSQAAPKQRALSSRKAAKNTIKLPVERHAIATISSKNHLHRVRVFFDAAKKWEPRAERCLLLVDRVDGYFDPQQEDFSITEIESLPTMPLSEIEAMLRRYDILEANNNFKGAYLLYLLNHLKYDKVLLFDPDAYITGSLQSVFDALSQRHCGIVTTPHALDPVEDNEHTQRDIAFLKFGLLNLGFIGVRRSSPRVDQFLAWWQDRMATEGYYRPEEGLFSDQKWVDLAFTYFGDCHCALRDRSLNVAYWNMHDRARLIRYDDKTRRTYVGSTPLTFFHFSAWNPDTDPTQLSKWLGHKYSLQNVPALVPLYEEYRRQVVRFTGDGKTLQWPYAFEGMN